MNRPDFATLMGEHASVGSDERMVGDDWVWGFDCECGEFVPDMQCNQHLADAINHAIDAWLADEETREAVRVAIVAYEAEVCTGQGTLEDTSTADYATAALAALTQREDTP